jgi:DNA-binding FadR family transcriptional regulator
MPLHTVSHHTDIVDAIAQGDGPAARLVLETYLEESASVLVSAMEKQVIA